MTPAGTSPARRAQREDVAGLDEVVRCRRRVDRDVNGVRAVGGRDAGRHALAGLDRIRECSAEVRLVPLRHLREAELLAALSAQAEADQAACVRRHEVDGVRGPELRGDDDVPLVLALGIVDDDDHLPVPDVLDRLLDPRERCDGRAHGSLAANRRSTTLPSTSASRLTWSPGSRLPSVVTASE